jgi:hypothetical protein
MPSAARRSGNVPRSNREQSHQEEGTGGEAPKIKRPDQRWEGLGWPGNMGGRRGGGEIGSSQREGEKASCVETYEGDLEGEGGG